MYATEPTRYFIEWESLELYNELERQAKEDGSYSPDHDDWYDPVDIQESLDIADVDSMRVDAREIAVTESLFAQVRIFERIGIHRNEYGYWNYREIDEVETVYAP